MSDEGAQSNSQRDANAGNAAGAEPSAERVETILGDHAGVHIASPTDDQPPEEELGGEVSVDFGSFVVSLGTNCMINLGHIQHPEINESVQDLQSAHHTIQLLEMLRVKTKGNLVEEEARLLDSLIHDLKSAYLKETRSKN